MHQAYARVEGTRQPTISYWTLKFARISGVLAAEGMSIHAPTVPSVKRAGSQLTEPDILTPGTMARICNGHR